MQEKDNLTVNETVLPQAEELAGERVRGPGTSSPPARVAEAATAAECRDNTEGGGDGLRPGARGALPPTDVPEAELGVPEGETALRLARCRG